MSRKSDELKNLLHESIENVDDVSVLRAVKELLDRKYVPEEEIEISYEQKKRIEEARESIEKGDYLSNEEADRIVSDWLKK
mgnify:CR=1 FL=1